MSTLPLATAAAEPVSTQQVASAGRLRRRWTSAVRGRFGFALADQVVYSIGNMVVAAMLSRHCGQRQFGIYILTQRAMDVLIQLCNVMLWGPFTFNLPGVPEGRRASYQGSIFGLQFVACGLFTGVLYAAAHWAGALAQSDFREAFSPLILASGGILFREFTRRMYFAQMRMREAFWTEVATVVLQIAGVEWLYVRHELNVLNTLYVLCAGASVVSCWWIVRDAPRLKIGLHSIWSDLRVNLQLGRWFLGSNMVFMASSQCNPWVLGAVMGGFSVGAYAICESVVNIPRVALTSMQNVMGPALATAHAEQGKQGVINAVKRLDRMLLAGTMGCALLLWVFGPSVARFIFKISPGNTRLILTLLSVNLVAYACTLAQSYGLTALGRVNTTFYANAAGLLVQAALCLSLVHLWGVPGAAVAMLLGNLIVLALRQMFYRQTLATA